MSTTENTQLASQLQHMIQDGKPGIRPLLEDAAANPDQFEFSVQNYISTYDTPLRSEPGRHYDMYSDLVLRHLSTEHPVLRKQVGRTCSEFTRANIHEASGRLATLWRRVVHEGTRVALVARDDLLIIIALVTGFRLGLRMSFVPHLGKSFVENRLRLLEPEAVVFDDHSLLNAQARRQWPSLPIRAPLSTPRAVERTFAYKPDDVVLDVISTFSSDLRVVSLTSRQLHSRLAVDTALILGLHPGHCFASLDAVPIQNTPVLQLAVLFGGATWVSLLDTSVLRDSAPKLHHVVMSAEARDEVLRGDWSPQGWHRWFKNPSEPYEWSPWKDFGYILASKNCLGQNLLVSASHGGCLLFSQASDDPGLRVQPSPGLSWMLEEPGMPGQPTLSGTGVLTLSRLGATPVPCPPSQIGNFLLSDMKGHFLFSGYLRAGRYGLALPNKELSASIRSLPAVDDAVVITNPISGLLNGFRSSLVVFVDPASDPQPVSERLRSIIKSKAMVELGSQHLPDQILIYPLTPRRDNSGEVDLAWCTWQLQSGGFETKLRKDSHRLISLLRRWTEIQLKREQS